MKNKLIKKIEFLLTKSPNEWRWKSTSSLCEELSFFKNNEFIIRLSSFGHIHNQISVGLNNSSFILGEKEYNIINPLYEKIANSVRDNFKKQKEKEEKQQLNKDILNIINKL